MPTPSTVRRKLLTTSRCDHEVIQFRVRQLAAVPFYGRGIGTAARTARPRRMAPQILRERVAQHKHEHQDHAGHNQK